MKITDRFVCCPATAEELKAWLEERKTELCRNRGEALDLMDRAVCEWPIEFEEPEIIPDSHRIMGLCIGCYLSGVLDAGEDIAGDYKDFVKEGELEKQWLFELFLGMPETSEEARKNAEALYRWQNGWTALSATDLIESALQYCPITFSGEELMPGDNHVLGMCISCYLEGVRATFEELIENVVFFIKDHPEVTE